jgi:hypothetical protein
MTAPSRSWLDAAAPARTDHLQRIRRVSRLMAWACLALIVVLPLALVYYWMITSTPELAASGNLAPRSIAFPLQLWQRVAAAAITGVPLGLLLMGLYQARLCFVQFEQGDVFSALATARLRRFAGWVAAAALAAIVAAAVTSVVLSINNPPGTRQLAIGVGSNQIFTLFFAGLVWLMADIIGQGQALADENQRFV